MKSLLFLFTVILFGACSHAKLTTQNNSGSNIAIKTGAEQTEKYLGYLSAGKMPEWEVPNMIAKYYTTTLAKVLASKK